MRRRRDDVTRRDGAVRRRGDAGSVTLEFAVLAPALLLFLGLLVYGGRVMTASGSVTQAAAEAARSASIARTAAQARTEATDAATRALTRQGLQCQTTSVTVDTSGFAVRVGLPAEVSATVRCAVRVGDLLIPGVPGTRTVTATTVSSLDSYRGRS